eukprot:4049761-Prymnesium_polylepis.1
MTDSTGIVMPATNQAIRGNRVRNPGAQSGGQMTRGTLMRGGRVGVWACGRVACAWRSVRVAWCR